MLNVYPIRLRFISARLLASVASIFKSAGCKGISFVAVKKLILNVSERPRTGVVPRSSDVFAPQKLASRSVHGCTLLDRLFQKAYGKCVFKSGSGVCIYFVLHKNKYLTFQNGQGCPWFYAAAMFLRSKNSRSKIDKEVNF